MNLFKTYLLEIKKKLFIHKNELNINSKKDFDNIILESPPDKFDFDLSTNAAMIIAKKNNANSRDIAIKIKEILLKESKNFSDISIAGPGFINLKLNARSWVVIINEIIKTNKKFGSSNNNKKFNIEFVSANPTGPLHIGHCRGAIFGDVLSNLLKFNGNKVIREYYVNDYGNQIDNFVKSVYLRLREIKFKEEFPNQENLYPGSYIIDIANQILLNNKKIDLSNFKANYKLLKKRSIQNSMSLIKSDLNKLGVEHNVFFYENDLVNKNIVAKTVNFLKKKNFITEGYLDPPKGEINLNWKKVKRLIFKSTSFGDDSDRALQKNDGSWTYFANDVAYHSTKVKKNFNFLINVLGADHTGYIKRISSAVSALSNNKVKLICKVCQLVKLYKNGKPYKMSKRLGEFVSVKDLLKEVNKDSVRFMMLNRGNDMELDFDFDKVLERSKDNPVFYVQYSYARINSLFNSLNMKLNKKINLKLDEFIPNNYEYKLLRKINEWPRIVELASNKYEPHRIPFYLYELATIFHAYWSKGNEDQKYKFISDGKINNILSFKIFQLVAIVLENGMKILGVSLPKKM